MSTEYYLVLPDGTRLNPSSISSILQTDSCVKIELLNGRCIYAKHSSVDEAITYRDYYTRLLNSVYGETLPQPLVDTNMQNLYGDADAPTTDPPDITKPACYRGRTNNTVWFWDTGEKAWYPVSNV